MHAKIMAICFSKRGYKDKRAKSLNKFPRQRPLPPAAPPQNTETPMLEDNIYKTNDEE